MLHRNAKTMAWASVPDTITRSFEQSAKAYHRDGKIYRWRSAICIISG
jgi:hypothetical protein